MDRKTFLQNAILQNEQQIKLYEQLIKYDENVSLNVNGKFIDLVIMIDELKKLNQVFEDKLSEKV